MSMKRFVAPTARDCLRRVKEELGADAIVVSNKPVQGGIEIMAMTSAGFEALSRQITPREREARSAAPAAAFPSTASPVMAPARPAPRSGMNESLRQAYASPSPVSPPPQRNIPEPPAVRAGTQPGARSEEDYTVSLSSRAGKPVASPLSAPASFPSLQDEKPKLRPLPGRDPAVLRQEAPAAISSAVSPAAARVEEFPRQDSEMQTQVSQLMGEVHGIRALLERQLAGFAWGEMSRETPVRALALAEMLDSGFSGQLARKLCQEMSADLTIEDARKWLQGALNRRLRTLSSDNDIIDRGGVYALVGPTGVGKTTTTAKLAARCVVRYGADKIALLTTDGYRIGAHEQLRIYGRILGVPVHVVRDGEDLRHTLADLHDKHMVLIDTVGMSQRDRMVTEQAAMLMRAGEINRLLLLNATSRGDTLDDVVRAYAGEDLAGVILSKVDETASVAPALDVVIRHGLLLCYIANGQRVPEDMHLPNRNYLMHRAFKAPEAQSPHRLQEDEAGLLMATAGVSRKAAGGTRG